MVHVIRAYNDAPPDMEYLVHALTEQFENLRIDGEPLGMGEAAIATFDNLIEKRKAS
jgi:hypothetical protein